jgi:predicted DNA-binding transcriptional regulator AlpA
VFVLKGLAMAQMNDTPQRLESRTVPIRVAFRELGVGKTSGYEAVRAGTFPLPVIRLGRRLVVARAELDRILGQGDGR